MSIDLYMNILSQPSRSVYNFCLENGIEHKVISLDLSKGEHKKEEYLKINPQGAVPSISENGFNLAECAAIMIYLQQSRKLPDHW